MAGQEQQPSGTNRPGFFRKAVRAVLSVPATLLAPVGFDAIRSGFSFILSMFSRAKPQRDRQVFVETDRVIDMGATAFSHGMSVTRLEALFCQRQRETARVAYSFFGLGWLCVAYLVYCTLGSDRPIHVFVILQFLAVIAVFFLMAFLAAIQNYHLRKRRLVTAAEYLRAADGFWPRG